MFVMGGFLKIQLRKDRKQKQRPIGTETEDKKKQQSPCVLRKKPGLRADYNQKNTVQRRARWKPLARTTGLGLVEQGQWAAQAAGTGLSQGNPGIKQQPKAGTEHKPSKQAVVSARAFMRLWSRPEPTRAGTLVGPLSVSCLCLFSGAPWSQCLCSSARIHVSFNLGFLK